MIIYMSDCNCHDCCERKKQRNKECNCHDCYERKKQKNKECNYYDCYERKIQCHCESICNLVYDHKKEKTDNEQHIIIVINK